MAEQLKHLPAGGTMDANGGSDGFLAAITFRYFVPRRRVSGASYKAGMYRRQQGGNQAPKGGDKSRGTNIYYYNAKRGEGSWCSGSGRPQRC